MMSETCRLGVRGAVSSTLIIIFPFACSFICSFFFLHFEPSLGVFRLPKTWEVLLCIFGCFAIFGFFFCASPFSPHFRLFSSTVPSANSPYHTREWLPRRPWGKKRKARACWAICQNFPVNKYVLNVLFGNVIAQNKTMLAQRFLSPHAFSTPRMFTWLLFPLRKIKTKTCAGARAFSHLTTNVQG